MIGRAVYHVPRSQVWEGSRGRQSGNVHLHVTADFVKGRLSRRDGEALCSKKRPWYGRPAEFESEMTAEARCPACVELGLRYGVEWP